MLCGETNGRMQMATSTMVMETIFTEGVAHLSYLIGDKATGKAAVIDPRRDVDVYIELARDNKLTITHVLETHIHADFVSGTRELCDRTGTARAVLSVEGGAEYGFECDEAEGRGQDRPRAGDPHGPPHARPHPGTHVVPGG